MFATSCGNWANPLKFVDLISESTGFFQELGCARLATPNPYRGKHRQCRAARCRLRLGRQIRRRDSIVPMATGQLEPAVAGLQVGMKADELGFLGQRQRLDHQRLRLIKAELVKQAPDQADVRATRILDIVDGQCNTHSFVQIFMPAADLRSATWPDRGWSGHGRAPQLRLRSSPSAMALLASVAASSVRWASMASCD